MTAAALEHSLDSPPWTPDTSPPAVMPVAANEGGPDAALRAEIRARRRAKAEAELQRVQTIDEPWKEPGHDKATRKLLREAREARTQGELANEEARRLRKASREAKLQGRGSAAASLKAQADIAATGFQNATRTAVELERQAQLRIDERNQARWSGAVLAERRALEAMRGTETDDVVTEVMDWIRDENGALARDRRGVPLLGTDKARTVRVLASEGLRLAFENGDLDRGEGDEDRFSAERLLETGKRFRDAYETYANLSSPDRDAGAPSAPRCKPSTGPQNAAFEAGELLSIMTGRVSDRQRKTRGVEGLVALAQVTEFEARVLVQVCGRDETVRATAGLVRKRHSTVRKALRSGLVTATINTAME